MTREELLQKLADKARNKVATREDFISTLDNLISDLSDEQITTWNIIREIVELHSPDYDEVNGDICPQCSEGEYWTPYPCITIQAIEKELE